MAIGHRFLKGQQFVLQLFCIEHGGRNAAQATGFEDGRRQLVVLRSGHGGLNQPKTVRVEK
jgi:hypothetical protein